MISGNLTHSTAPVPVKSPIKLRKSHTKTTLVNVSMLVFDHTVWLLDRDVRWVYTFYASLCNLICNNTCTVTFDKTSPQHPKSIDGNIYSHWSTFTFSVCDWLQRPHSLNYLNNSDLQSVISIDPTDMDNATITSLQSNSLDLVRSDCPMRSETPPA